MSLPSIEMKPRPGKEVWIMQTPGTLYLRTTIPNRMGQLVESEMTIGPNRPGHRFQISVEDREENQSRCVDPAFDPFRNGTLTRADADQQQVPETASEHALDSEGLLDILDLPQDQFEARLPRMAEIPLRRMEELGLAMDVSHRRLDVLREHINERFSVSRGQSSVSGSAEGERLS